MAGPSSHYNDDLSSEFDADSEHERAKRKRLDLAVKSSEPRKAKADKEYFAQEWNKEDRKQRFLAYDAYTRHKILVNEYMLYYPGATSKILKRDTTRDKTDLDVIRENSKFLWDESQEAVTWGQKLAKRYYDKLFKEYCVTDLSRYKENKIAMRWRTEKEVIDGKGQFVCGEKRCNERQDLTSWEVNFGYMEDGQKKNALVKLRLCPECSYKLNYHHKRRRVTKPSQKEQKHVKSEPESEGSPVAATSTSTMLKQKQEDEQKSAEEQQVAEKELWSKPIEVEKETTREDEFTEFLEDLFV